MAVERITADSHSWLYLDVVTAYWRLHISRRGEALWLSQLCQLAGMPIRFTSAKEMTIISGSATVFAAGVSRRQLAGAVPRGMLL